MSGRKGAIAFSRLISHISSLEDIRWASTRMDKEGGKALLESLVMIPNLNSLDISDCTLSDDCGPLLADVIKSHKLKVLKLGDVNLNGENVRNIIEGLKNSQDIIEVNSSNIIKGVGFIILQY